MVLKPLPLSIVQEATERAIIDDNDDNDDNDNDDNNYDDNYKLGCQLSKNPKDGLFLPFRKDALAGLQ